MNTHPRSESILAAFRYAFAGITHVLKSQRNASIHLAATIAVVASAYWLECSNLEWAVLTLTIGSVWLAEFFNTAIESSIDLCSPDRHPLAKTAKDVAAAAVLIAAITAVIVGLLILGPPLWTHLN